MSPGSGSKTKNRQIWAGSWAHMGSQHPPPHCGPSLKTTPFFPEAGQGMVFPKKITLAGATFSKIGGTRSERRINLLLILSQTLCNTVVVCLHSRLFKDKMGVLIFPFLRGWREVIVLTCFVFGCNEQPRINKNKTLKERGGGKSPLGGIFSSRGANRLQF